MKAATAPVACRACLLAALPTALTRALSHIVFSIRRVSKARSPAHSTPTATSGQVPVVMAAAVDSGRRTIDTRVALPTAAAVEAALMEAGDLAALAHGDAVLALHVGEEGTQIEEGGAPEGPRRQGATPRCCHRNHLCRDHRTGATATARASRAVVCRGRAPARRCCARLVAAARHRSCAPRRVYLERRRPRPHTCPWQRRRLRVMRGKWTPWQRTSSPCAAA